MRLSVPTTDIIESAFVTVFLALVVCTSLGSFPFIKATIDRSCPFYALF